MKKSLVVALLLALFLLAGCAGTKTTSSTAVKTYVNHDYGYSLKYDSNVVAPHLSELPVEGQLTFFGPKKMQGSIFVVAHHKPSKVDSAFLRGWLQTAVRSYGPHRKQGVVEPVVVGGLSGFTTQATVGGSLKTATYTFANGRDVYLISGQSGLGDWKALETALSGIVKSFTVAK